MRRARKLAVVAALLLPFGCSLVTTWDGLDGAGGAGVGAGSTSRATTQAIASGSGAASATGSSGTGGGGTSSGSSEGGGSSASGGGAAGGASTGGAGGEPVDAGRCVAGGLYCGGDKLTGDPGVLYRCNADGTGTPIEACTLGCLVRPPGHDDACRCTPGGLYCGGDKVEGDPDTLYKCKSDGTGSVVRRCPNACVVHPHQDDTCS